VANSGNNNNASPAGALYLTAAVYLIWLLLSGFMPRSGDIYGYGIILQFAAILLPASLYCNLRGDDLLLRMRITLFSPAKTVFLLLFVLALFCGSVLFGFVFGSNGTVQENGEVSFMAVVCIAVLPAIAEEMLFRGILMSELEKHGAFAAVVVSSLMFAMFHFSLKGIVGYFFCGLLLALCVYVTRSLLASFAVHIAYNLLLLLGGGRIKAFFDISGDAAFMAVLLIAVLLVCLILIFGECQRTYALYAEQNLASPHAKRNGSAGFLAALFSPAAAVCMIIFIVALVM